MNIPPLAIYAVPHGEKAVEALVGIEGTSMIGTSQGETEIPLDPTE